jgi:hypothetical protein
VHDHELIETEWRTMPHIKPTEKLVITSEVVNIGNRYGHKLAGITNFSVGLFEGSEREKELKAKGVI